jgi:hypothetical protein
VSLFGEAKPSYTYAMASAMFHFFVLCPLSAALGAPEVSSEANGLANAKAHLRSIPLQKQYVPVMKEGKTVAYKTAYFGKVQAGTPAHDFTVVFDTGSGHFILPSTKCRSDACAKHKRYDILKSTSSTEIEYDGNPVNKNSGDRDQVVVSFGTGKVTGEFVEDVVCVGEDPPDCVKLRVVLATEMTDDPFGHFAFDGVLGLGLDALRLKPEFSFFGEMIKQNPSMLPQFSVFLSRHEGGNSMISFGGYDEKLTTSELTWAPVLMPVHGDWIILFLLMGFGECVVVVC